LQRGKAALYEQEKAAKQLTMKVLGNPGTFA
jgi:hypothetical protein